MSYIIRDEDYKKYSVGTKAENLFRMLDSGITVPKLFCISNKILKQNEGIEKIISKVDFNDEKSIMNSSLEIEKYIEDSLQKTDLKSYIQEFITENFEMSCDFSVRSSSMVEDSDTASFAGQFDSFLNIDRNNIFEYVIKCFKSLYKPNVLVYCNKQNISTSDLAMNVIVQEMINGEFSGILFTANPQGILNESVIVVGKGTGENVVEDKVPTTSYYYNLTDSVYYYESQEDGPIINEELVNEIMEISADIKSIFGQYLDIEFTIKNNEIYILQCRPITTLKNNNQLILDNSNIVESYPGITLPLTESFISFAYTSVFRGLAYRCLKNEKIIDKYDDVFKEMVGSANGRIYYKISNWYTVIKFLPFSNKIIPIWQEMLGVSNKEYKNEKNDISLIQSIKVYYNAITEAFSIQKNMRELNKKFIKVNGYFKKNYSENLSNKELVKLYDELKKAVLQDWDITLLNDMYGFLFTGLLKGRLKRLGIENYEVETNKYIAGISNIESMKPIRELIRITNIACNNNLIDELKVLNTDEEVNKYINNDSKLSNEIKIYIELFGDRSLEELKLESKTFRSKPLLLINKIVEYGSDKEKLREITESFKTIEITTIPEDKITRYLSSKAMIGIKNREISRLNRSVIYGMVRSIFLAIGNNLVKENKIEKKEDIFYLYTHEVFSFIEGENIEFKGIIATRKNQYDMYNKLPAYSRLIFENVEFNKTHENVNKVKVTINSKDIIGIPCSNGRILGDVVVIENPTEVKEIKDKILVTKMTDPGWVFLLTMAKGIITEKGSLLSHTAIISRELGIPSIVGVKNITNILKTGDRIMLNGDTGSIEILEDEKC